MPLRKCHTCPACGEKIFSPLEALLASVGGMKVRVREEDRGLSFEPLPSGESHGPGGGDGHTVLAVMDSGCAGQELEGK